MRCPKCGSANTYVYAGRDINGWRRRNMRCMDCGEGFSTVEVIVQSNKPIEQVNVEYKSRRDKKCT